MTTKIICLIGASGSEKKMVAKELENRGYNVIQSYTTRPPREDGEWGHTFIEEYDVYKDGDRIMINDITHVMLHYKHDMIAYFNSYKSGHHYFATDDQVIRGKINIYVVDSKGAEMVHKFYKDSDVEVITVYLQVDEQERRNRMINRAIPTISQFRSGKTYSHQALLKEVSSRLESDKLLFQIVKCDYVVDGNSNLSYILTNIEQIIEVEND